MEDTHYIYISYVIVNVSPFMNVVCHDLSNF